MGRHGITLVETLIAVALLLSFTAGIYVSLLQSFKYLNASRQVRRAVSDLHSALEQVIQIPKNELFVRFPAQYDIDENLIGGFTLADEHIQLVYLPGDPKTLLLEGDNTLQFKYGSGSDSYQVTTATLTIATASGSASCGPLPGSTVSSSETATLPCNVPAALRNMAVQIYLDNVMFSGVDAPEEVEIFLNGQGPFRPAPNALGGGRIDLPAMQPLRIFATCTWAFDNKAFTRTLSTARFVR